MNMGTKRIYANNPLRNFSYIVYQEEEAYVIDPYCADQIQHKLESDGFELRAIINTHAHNDHTRGNQELLQKNTDCKVWGHSLCNPDKVLEDGEILNLFTPYKFKVMYTPGHHDSHICLLLVDAKYEYPEVLFSGDTLFNAGVGNCKNGGDVDMLFHTIQTKIGTLPNGVLVYPGHEYWENNLKFTLSIDPENTLAKKILNTVKKVKPEETPKILLGEERELNCFLRLKHFKDKLGLDTEHATFRELRRLRDRWKSSGH